MTLPAETDLWHRLGAAPFLFGMSLKCVIPASTVKKRCWKSHQKRRPCRSLGTSDAREVKERTDAGDAYAALIYDAMIYQIGKEVGAMAAVLHGNVDGIILTGGISYDTYVVQRLKEMISFVAPVTVMAGEFEMEALASGAIRVLSGKEEAKTLRHSCLGLALTAYPDK